jgi:antitoxin CptB
LLKKDRLNRLKYQSWHRGTRENDLIFGRFADKHLSTLTDKELDEYEKILEEKDVDLFHWITGSSSPSCYPLLTKIQTFYGIKKSW